MARVWFRYGVVCVGILACNLCGTYRTSQGQLVLYEPFDYQVGTGLGGGQGGTATAPLGYTNASSGTAWHAHQVGAGYNQSLDAQVVTGSLSYGNLATSGNSVTSGSGATGASNRYADGINLPQAISRPGTDPLPVYFSFLVHLNSQVQNNGVIGNRFGFAELSSQSLVANGLSLSADAQSSSTVPMPGTIWVRPDISGAQAATHSQFGIGKSNTDAISAAGSATWMQSGLAAATTGSTRQGVDVTPWDQTYFIVGKYTLNDPAFDSLPSGLKNNQEDSVSIFVNPPNSALGTNAGEASAVTNSLYSATGGVGAATPDLDAINSFVLLGHRQSGAANGNASAAYTFDELRIGMTWADVTPVSNSPGTLGDFNSDGKVDSGDYATWRKSDGTNNALANDNGLGTPVGLAHYNLWRANFGKPPGSGAGLGAESVPEPATLGLIGVCVWYFFPRVRSGRVCR